MQRRTFLSTAALATCSSLSYTAFADDDLAIWKKELGKHRLKRIEVGQVQMRWPRLVGKNARLDVHGRGPRQNVCRLHTDRGITGWGAVRGGAKAGQDAFQAHAGKPLNQLFDPALGVLNGKLAPLDFALHDLAGVILDLPVYKMLGAHGTKATPCYSGMIYFDDLEPPERPAGIDKVLANCDWDVEYGYRQLKVKIGRGNRWMKKEAGLARDIEITKAIGKLHPEVDILVDANNGYSIDDALAYLEGIGDIDLFWFEEPFHENIADYKRLDQWLTRNKKKTHIADGEARPDWDVLNEMSRTKLLDVQLVDIVGYGFTPWRKLMPKLKEQGVLTSPHAWGTQLKSYYTAHLAAGLGNVVTIEGVTCSSPDVDFGDYHLKEGKLVVSDEPGFGMQLTKELS